MDDRLSTFVTNKYVDKDDRLSTLKKKKKIKKKIKIQIMLKPGTANLAMFFLDDKVVNFIYPLSYLQANVSFSVQKYRKPYV